MRSLIAFTKKEITEQIRTCKVLLFVIIFALLGIMNPAVAKLTPWLLEMFSDSLEGSGMVITEVTVSAMDSWVQFFKNIPIGLIAFILIESSIFTKEYQTGTLVLSLTKGLSRGKVILAKATVLSVFWTVGFWLCFGITYLYNSYYWDNSVAKNLVFSVVCWWLFGLFAVCLVVLFSTVFSANTSVLGCTGGVVLLSYLVGLIPKFAKYMPTYLTGGNALIYGAAKAEDYIVSAIITVAGILICFGLSFPIFNKKIL